MMELITNFDKASLLFIHDHIRNAILDPIMIAASRLGDKGILWIILALVFIFIKKTRKAGIYQAASLAAEFLTCDLIIKKLVQRARPYIDITQLSILVSAEHSASFPSGHSASSFACAFALTYILGKKGAWAYLPATLIALSRLYVGVHYPTDVISGAIWGTLIALVTCKLLDKIFKWRKKENKL